VDPNYGATRKINECVRGYILADTCMEADAYATAFMAMDLESFQLAAIIWEKGLLKPIFILY